MTLFEVLAYNPEKDVWHLVNCWGDVSAFWPVGAEGRWKFDNDYCDEFYFGGEAFVLGEIDPYREREADRYLDHNSAAGILAHKYISYGVEHRSDNPL